MRRRTLIAVGFMETALPSEIEADEARRSERRPKAETGGRALRRDLVVKCEDADLATSPIVRYLREDGRAYLDGIDLVSRRPRQAWHRSAEMGDTIPPRGNVPPPDSRHCTNAPPFSATTRFDCTILVLGWNGRSSFGAAVVSRPLDGSRDAEPRRSDESAGHMEAMPREESRARQKISGPFADQPYPLVYHQLVRRRPWLGRSADHGPGNPYAFSGTGLAESGVPDSGW